MTGVSVYFIGTVILVSCMMLLSLTRTRSAWVHRGGVILMYLLFLPVLFMGYQSLTGNPRPTWAQIKYSEVDSDLLWFAMIPDEAIYILVVGEDDAEPTYYALPWSEKTAKELAEAAEEAMENQSVVKVKMSRFTAELLKREKSNGQGEPGEDDMDIIERAIAQAEGWETRERVFHAAPPSNPPPNKIESELRIIRPE